MSEDSCRVLGGWSATRSGQLALLLYLQAHRPSDCEAAELEEHEEDLRRRRGMSQETVSAALPRGLFRA